MYLLESYLLIEYKKKNDFPLFQVLAVGVAVAGVAAVAINAAQANTNRLNDEDAKLAAQIDTLSGRVATLEGIVIRPPP